jgi:ACT domain-containing protein
VGCTRDPDADSGPARRARQAAHLIAEARGNVVSVEHHREGMDVPVAETEVELTLITHDQEHCTLLLDEMHSWGYTVERLK